MQRSLLLLGVLAAVVPFEGARAQQANYVLDQQRSMVWWQLDPHFGHLWATSCPRDPSWQPGEGHSSGYAVNYKKRPKYKQTKEAESNIPLFPRDTVRANCRRAVAGNFTAADAKRFSGMRGVVIVQVDSITNGSDSRDKFTDKYVYSSAKYPTVKFTVDSLTNLGQKGDTVTAVAVGTFSLRGVDSPARVQVHGVPEGNALRVRGMWAMPAKELQQKYGVSKVAMGLGIGLKLWDTLFMGFDLLLNQR